MDSIGTLDKNKADILKTKGFKYQLKNIDTKIVYKFVKTPDLEAYLNSNFSKGEFFTIPYVNF